MNKREGEKPFLTTSSERHGTHKFEIPALLGVGHWSYSECPRGKGCPSARTQVPLNQEGGDVVMLVGCMVAGRTLRILLLVQLMLIYVHSMKQFYRLD